MSVMSTHTKTNLNYSCLFISILIKNLITTLCDKHPSQVIIKLKTLFKNSKIEVCSNYQKAKTNSL